MQMDQLIMMVHVYVCNHSFLHVAAAAVSQPARARGQAEGRALETV